jgi:hypothetical protein
VVTLQIAARDLEKPGEPQRGRSGAFLQKLQCVQILCILLRGRRRLFLLFLITGVMRGVRGLQWKRHIMIL